MSTAGTASPSSSQPIIAHGIAIPPLGLGTWSLKGETALEAVAAAFDAGYRHIDTAIAYGNEAEIGEAVRASGLPRADVFVTSKIPAEQLGADAMLRAAEGSVERLGIGPVDLMLIHWPNRTLGVAPTIRALNAVKRAGLARSIGLSNHTIRMLDEAVAVTEEPLVANQCEHHPYLSQTALIEATKRHGMAFVAYCPLGQAEVFDEPIIQDIAMRLGRSPAQILLRWQIEKGCIPIPRSRKPARIRQNADIFGFSLDAAEIAAIDGLGVERRRICDIALAPDWDE